MKIQRMKVRDLLKQEIDIDVYDDVVEELGIAFCGPLELTAAGEKKFSTALDLTVEIINGDMAIVDVDDEEGKWQKKLRNAKDLFESAAGLCAEDDWELWFKEV